MILIEVNEMATPISTQMTFVNLTVEEAKKRGYLIEEGTQNGRQIDFGNKKLHEGHLRALYPSILQPEANISALIDRVAPGRPCTHKPMREIIYSLTAAGHH
jgi:hypothetical protein